MRLEIDIPEHHYNNIMAFDSVNLGRVPYKGIIMYAINAIKHGRVLEQEPTTKNDLGVETTQMIDKSNFSQEQYKSDLQSAYDCGYAQAKNDSGVDCISRTSALDSINWAYNLSDAYQKINDLPSVTPQNQMHPLCEDCHTKMDEVRRAYDNIIKQEPRKGHWILTSVEGNRVWYCNCSECGKDPQNNIFGSEDWWLLKSKLPKFCPNCGAKMESEAEE